MIETGWARRAIVIATMAVSYACIPAMAEAQDRVPPVDSLRQIQSISPRSGPVGTEVEVYTDNMPLEARFHIGVGATRSGFESLYEADQVALGEITVTLPIPQAVSPERAVVFVAFNAVFSPIAMSKPFHVTDERGRLERTGEVDAVEASCVAFRDTDGFMYELVGRTDGLGPGDSVVLEAEYIGESDCVDGAEIRVVEARPTG